VFIAPGCGWNPRRAFVFLLLLSTPRVRERGAELLDDQCALIR